MITIAVVDYGIGNLGSAVKAFARVGSPATLSGDPEVLDQADALVLPGDGAFGASMEELRRRGLLPVLQRAIEARRPLLGICIGMQLLFEESDEHGRHRGLGVLPGRLTRFAPPLVVPHMGWNQLEPRQPHAVMDGVPAGSHVYFVHSYRAPADAAHTVAACDYGGDFAAVVAKDSVVGVQFHPEKSQDVGLRMVANFVRMVEGRS